MFKAIKKRFILWLLKEIDFDYTGSQSTLAVANFGDSTVYSLLADKIVAKRGSVVKRNQYWLNENTNRIHVVSSNYRSSAELTREDLVFSKWDTGKSYYFMEDALLDQPYSFQSTLDLLSEQGIEVEYDEDIKRSVPQRTHDRRKVIEGTE